MAIKKKSFKDIKSKFSKKATYKPDRFFDLGEAFLDASGIPGPAMGHINMFLGHTDTGKTTALVKTALDAQRKEILPVLIITEQKWDFEHGVRSTAVSYPVCARTPRTVIAKWSVRRAEWPT